MQSSKFRRWLGYQKALRLCRSIERLTYTFPRREERRLSDQIIRSSRSVCANLAEAYGRRAYPKHFTAKVTDCITENYETQVWLDIALDSQYLATAHYHSYILASEEVGKLLSYMLRNPGQFTLPPGQILKG
ncbi:four helix bundle protein [Neolewinella xylanilytica]|uniref:Four helix bundle protein n=1 Tax=Neolewinella xylanilytica TaxID=1514080 RepID=A0A2S6I8L4_9BACT|nr:four helix bundle protein [Neolewinella xylanilytica]PPK87819.1 four helix bundle protein [Neolewinella xylanilytica]